MAATAVCNYNNTNGFTQRGHGPQSVFMNGCVHHYMMIASTTSQNCGISYFIFDDIAALAGSAERQNVRFYQMQQSLYSENWVSKNCNHLILYKKK